MHLVHLGASNQSSNNQVALMLENRLENNKPLTQTVSEGSNIIGVDFDSCNHINVTFTLLFIVWNQPLIIIISHTNGMIDSWLHLRVIIPIGYCENHRLLLHLRIESNLLQVIINTCTSITMFALFGIIIEYRINSMCTSVHLCEVIQIKKY